MAAGYLLARAWAVRYGVDGDKFDGLALLYLPTIVVGARIGYVIATFSYFRENPWEIIRIDHGGLGSHGAIIAMVIVGWVSTRATKVRFWTMADAFGPVIPAAHIFVRIGNFANGELYGLPTSLPWGIVFPGLDAPHHPSMLYEALASVLTLALALWWAAHRRIEGEVFLKTMIAVSVVRILVDFTRFRGYDPFLGLMLTQWLALGAVLVCAGLLAVRRRMPAAML